MTVGNAVKKLERAGYVVGKMFDYGFMATKEGQDSVIEFLKNGREDDITCIRVRRKGDHDDSMTDYCAGVWCDNITRAIRLAEYRVAA